MSLLAELMSVDVLNLIGLLAVVFIGLPHGAMDGALAIHLGWMNRPIKAATFLMAYVGLAALVVGMWLVVPTVGFLVFLAISMFHFGRGDIVPRAKEHKLAEVLMRGGLVLAGISLFHRSEVDSIFEVLIGSDTEIVWLFLQAVGVLTLVLIPYVILPKSKQEQTAASVEVVGLLALFAIAPPLLGFAIYFCGVHSVRHFKHMGTMLKSTLQQFQVTRTTVIFSLMTWAVGLLVLANQSASIGLEPALLQVIFIGLAALTVPHMILVDGIAKHEQSSL
ncbi:MAG: Brp/Blh family beta-carotene 15,15'-dioxygenase [Candidatus Thermoplasmatota archaeon]|nr:Brp/Blh family beta-carotene 15,15'-dioxygenase [Candidatus Thermoplasmatota archaeon]